MAIARTYETFTSRPIAAFRLVDQFATFQRTQGPYPPLLGEIRMFVEERTDVGRVYDPARELVVWMNATGCVLTGGQALPLSTGDPSLVLASGTYKMRIESDYYLPDKFDVVWPPPAVTEVKLLPTPAYPFPDSTVNPAGMGVTILRGCLFREDGAPKAGVPVSVSIREAGWAISAGWPFAQATTNAKGEWVLILPDQREMIADPPTPLLKSLQVRFTIEGAVFDEQVPAGREGRFLQACLRGSAADRTGRPLASVSIENSIQAGASTTGLDGRWSIYFPIDQLDAPCSLEATDPNGQVLNRDTNVLATKAVLVERFQFP